jgi:hypothetical protein
LKFRKTISIKKEENMLYTSIECLNCGFETAFRVRTEYEVTANNSSVRLEPTDYILDELQPKGELVEKIMKDVAFEMAQKDRINKETLVKRVMQTHHLSRNITLDVVEGIKVQMGGYEQGDMIMFA